MLRKLFITICCIGFAVSCAQTERVLARPQNIDAAQIPIGQIALVDRPGKSTQFSQCGSALDYVDVENFMGSPEFDKLDNEKWSASVVQLQWDFEVISEARYSPYNDEVVLNPAEEPNLALLPVEPGNIFYFDDRPDENRFVGNRWCTASVIDVEKRYLLTAAHCFEPQKLPYPDANEWETPYIDGAYLGTGNKSLSQTELVKFFRVNFFFQGGDLKDAETRERSFHPPVRIEKLVEYGFGVPPFLDFAIVQLEDSEHAKSLLNRVGELKINFNKFAVGDPVIINQHPNGEPKKVMVGSTIPRPNEGDPIGIYYHELDTLGGSSGSPVLDRNGEVVGVHILGGCLEGTVSEKLANSAVPIFEIAKVSSQLIQ